jgi:hypothetical protein
MSWSLSFTGKMGIVRDSYHRIALTIGCNPSELREVPEEDLVSMVTLVNEGFKHLQFRVTEPYRDTSCSTTVRNCIMQYIDRLHANRHSQKVLNEHALTWNLAVMIMVPIRYTTCPLFLDFVTRPLGDTGVSFNLLVISDISPDEDVQTLNHHKVIEAFGNVVSAVRAKSSALLLGVADIFNRKTLQHLFEAHGAEISLVLPGNIDLPNLHARNVEFIHGRGCNTFYYLAPDVITGLDREQVPTLEPLLEKYDMCKNNLGTLLIKMLIQYGPIPCIDFDVGVDYLLELVSFMTHPFIYRTAQQAPTVVKRFQVNKSDIEDMLVESEEIECKADEEWMRTVLHTVAPRVLTDASGILKKKIDHANKFM